MPEPEGPVVSPLAGPPPRRPERSRRAGAGASAAAGEGRAPSRLETEIEALGRGRRIGADAAFRARVEQRLLSLESELGEVKTRLNGLLFFLAGTVIAQALLRLLV